MFAQKPTNPRAVLAALRAGDLSLGEYIDRLQAHFFQVERQVHAFVPEPERIERLRRDAAELEARYPHPDDRPPFYGLMIGVKDIFHADGLPTTGGSQLPPEALAGPEASVVTKMKELGALVFGKTITTEFAYFAPGPTRNPHNLEHTPGGSSSGSAAAVASGMLPFAFGTQTIGSLCRPASFCGVIGFKPTYDTISRDGVIPLSPSLDHIGLFAADLSLAHQAASRLIDEWLPPSNSLARPTLGVPAGPYLEHAEPVMRAHFEELRGRLAAAGYEIREVAAMPDYEDIRARHNRILAAEAAAVHAGWFAQFEEKYHPKTAELIRSGQAIGAAQLEQDRFGRVSLRNHLTELMIHHEIELWISPSAPGPAPAGIESTGDPVMNLPWTHSGLPTLSLPSGVDKAGLPLGLQLAAAGGQDERLFIWAAGIAEVLRNGSSQS
ncbi:MAG: amidase [Chloroflexi bacterium]|nr:amidase [Chloroflexota bacterium]